VNLRDRVVRPPPGPEPVGDRHKVGLEDRFQHQFQRRLDHPVGDGGDAEPAHLPAPAGLGDHAFPDRHRTELARPHLVSQIVQEALDTSLVDVAGPKAIDTGGPGPSVAHDPLPRNPQRRRVMHEVEQVVEPAAGIGRRPMVQLGLHPQYPGERPLRDRVVRGVGIHQRLSCHCSLLTARYRCRPSPCGRLSRSRTTTAAPPRPDSIGRRWTQPDRPRWRLTVRARVETVPVFTAIRWTKEEPDFVPVASPRLPRSTSPWPPAEPPMNRLGVPQHLPTLRAARWWVRATPRHLPDQAVLSSTALLRQGRRRWSLTSARINSASRRTGWNP